MNGDRSRHRQRSYFDSNSSDEFNLSALAHVSGFIEKARLKRLKGARWTIFMIFCLFVITWICWVMIVFHCSLIFLHDGHGLGLFFMTTTADETRCAWYSSEDIDKYFDSNQIIARICGGYGLGFHTGAFSIFLAILIVLRTDAIPNAKHKVLLQKEQSKRETTRTTPTEDEQIPTIESSLRHLEAARADSNRQVSKKQNPSQPNGEEEGKEINPKIVTNLKRLWRLKQVLLVLSFGALAGASCFAVLEFCMDYTPDEDDDNIIPTFLGTNACKPGVSGIMLLINGFLLADLIIIVCCVDFNNLFESKINIDDNYYAELFIDDRNNLENSKTAANLKDWMNSVNSFESGISGISGRSGFNNSSHGHVSHVSNESNHRQSDEEQGGGSGGALGLRDSRMTQQSLISRDSRMTQQSLISVYEDDDTTEEFMKESNYVPMTYSGSLKDANDRDEVGSNKTKDEKLRRSTASLGTLISVYEESEEDMTMDDDNNNRSREIFYDENPDGLTSVSKAENASSIDDFNLLDASNNEGNSNSNNNSSRSALYLHETQSELEGVTESLKESTALLKDILANDKQSELEGAIERLMGATSKVDELQQMVNLNNSKLLDMENINNSYPNGGTIIRSHNMGANLSSRISDASSVSSSSSSSSVFDDESSIKSETALVDGVQCENPDYFFFT